MRRKQEGRPVMSGCSGYEDKSLQAALLLGGDPRRAPHMITWSPAGPYTMYMDI